jgi:hypothetical protein
MSQQNKKNKVQISDLVSYGNFVLPSVELGKEAADLCEALDSFFEDYPKKHQDKKASDLVKGALYAVRPECRSNPDWKSQAANSLRDVIYPIISLNFKGSVNFIV